jgi:hypothetical protein
MIPDLIQWRSMVVAAQRSAPHPRSSGWQAGIRLLRVALRSAMAMLPASAKAVTRYGTGMAGNGETRR